MPPRDAPDRLLALPVRPRARRGGLRRQDRGAEEPAGRARGRRAVQRALLRLPLAGGRQRLRLSKPKRQLQGGERTNGPNFNVRKESRDDVLFAIRNGGFSGAIMPANIVVGRRRREGRRLPGQVLRRPAPRSEATGAADSRRRAAVLDLQADPRGPRGAPAPRSRAGAASRGALDEVLELDARRRELLPELEELRARQEPGVASGSASCSAAASDASEAIAEITGWREREKELTSELRGRRGAARDGARRAAQPARPTSAPHAGRGAARGGRGGRRRAATTWSCSADLVDMEAGARVAGLALRLPEGPARAARARARAVGARAARRRRASRPSIPPVLVREEALYGTGFLPGHRAADLPRARGRPLPGRHLRGAARLAARRPDPRRGDAAAALRRLLALLPPRGGRGRQGHARASSACTSSTRSRCSRSCEPGRVGRPSTSACWRSRRRSSRRSRSPTGW